MKDDVVRHCQEIAWCVLTSFLGAQGCLVASLPESRKGASEAPGPACLASCGSQKLTQTRQVVLESWRGSFRYWGLCCHLSPHPLGRLGSVGGQRAQACSVSLVKRVLVGYLCGGPRCSRCQGSSGMLPSCGCKECITALLVLMTMSGQACGPWRCSTHSSSQCVVRSLRMACKRVQSLRTQRPGRHTSAPGVRVPRKCQCWSCGCCRGQLLHSVREGWAAASPTS